MLYKENVIKAHPPKIDFSININNPYDDISGVDSLISSQPLYMTLKPNLTPSITNS